jgi:hypothetical protein
VASRLASKVRSTTSSSGLLIYQDSNIYDYNHYGDYCDYYDNNCQNTDNDINNNTHVFTI